MRFRAPKGRWGNRFGVDLSVCRRAAVFAPFKIYELWYEATGSKVFRIGFAAVGGLVLFLRNERTDRNATPNPLLAARRRPSG